MQKQEGSPTFFDNQDDIELTSKVRETQKTPKEVLREKYASLLLSLPDQITKAPNRNELVENEPYILDAYDDALEERFEKRDVVGETVILVYPNLIPPRRQGEPAKSEYDVLNLPQIADQFEEDGDTAGLPPYDDQTEDNPQRGLLFFGDSHDFTVEQRNEIAEIVSTMTSTLADPEKIGIRLSPREIMKILVDLVPKAEKGVKSSSNK